MAPIASAGHGLGLLWAGLAMIWAFFCHVLPVGWQCADHGLAMRWVGQGLDMPWAVSAIGWVWHGLICAWAGIGMDWASAGLCMWLA